MKEVALVVNTVSRQKDVWKLFFGQLEKHYPDNKVYVFTDNADGLPTYTIPVIYDIKDNFRTQYLNCIKQVDDEFIIYFNEDYILYDNVKTHIVEDYINEMKLNRGISFIKMNKNMNTTNIHYNGRNDLIYLNPNLEYFYSQTIAIWRTRDLEKIHELGPDLHIAGERGLQFEVAANDVCKNLGLQGLYSYAGEQKRGKYHYDSIVFPYVATAIVRGKWNLFEYFNELYPLLMKYGIDPNIRGSNI